MNRPTEPQRAGSTGAGRASRSERWLAWLQNARHGLPLLFLAAFLESIIVPIPIEVVLVPFMLLNRQRIWLIAGIATAGFLVGAMIGYGVGHVLFDTLGRWLLETMDYGPAFERFQAEFHHYGFWAILAVGLSPIPFPVAMLTAGATGYAIPLYLLAAGISRGIRYFGVAVLVRLFGERAMQVFRRFGPIAWIAAIAGMVLIIAAVELAAAAGWF